MEHPGLISSDAAINDPRFAGVVDPSKDVRSPLMKARYRARDNQKVNFCPFKCPLEDLDDNGYCEHLIGFTVDQKTYEPMVAGHDLHGNPNGTRVVQVPWQKGPKGTRVYLKPEIPEGAQLVQITSSYRVYVKKPKALPAPEADTEQTEEPRRKGRPRKEPVTA